MIKSDDAVMGFEEMVIKTTSPQYPCCDQEMPF